MKHGYELVNAYFPVDMMPVFTLSQRSLTGVWHLWGAGDYKTVTKELDIEEGISNRQREH